MREWQNTLTSDELPTFKQLMDFATHRCQILEVTGKASAPVFKANTRSAHSNSKRNSAFVAAVKIKCTLCGEERFIIAKSFWHDPFRNNIDKMRKAKVCLNCLRTTAHSASKCASGNCKICKMKHNTLLHITDNNIDKQVNNKRPRDSTDMTSSPAAIVTHSSSTRPNEYVMLSTAVVHAYDDQDSRKRCRLFLDSGSQTNFVSKRFLSLLNIKPESSNISILGINNTVTQATQVAQIKLQSRINDFSTIIVLLLTE